MKKKIEEKPHDIDVLEAYPEKEQVDAFPERRYIKMTRFLTIATIINLAMVIAASGFYFYMARHVDISVSNRNRIFLYSIDPERKLLLPTEMGEGAVHAVQLEVEKALRNYLEKRYSSLYDMDTMRRRWDENGEIARFSSQEVFEKFSTEKDRAWNEIWQNQITRDVHIYDLYLIHSDLWSAYIETFDFPVTENLEKICDCSDNSFECLDCKGKNTIKRTRKKIWLRAGFSQARRTLQNPLGIIIYAYYPAYVPVPKEGEKKETFWDLPPALRPIL